MPIPLVRINSATVEELETLHGIGAILANRIVDYRNQHGHFRSPEDLDRVEGISQELALALSPHIDWGTPEESASKKKREWWILLVAIPFGYFWGVLILLGFKLTITALQMALNGQPSWFRFGAMLSLHASLICFTVGIVAGVLEAISVGRKRESIEFTRVFILGLIFGGTLTIILVLGDFTETMSMPIPLLSSMRMLQDVLSPFDGSANLWYRRADSIVALVSVLGFAVALSPVIVVSFGMRVVVTHFVASISALAWFVGGGVALFGTILLPHFPDPVLPAFQIGFGFVLLWMGYSSIRYGMTRTYIAAKVLQLQNTKKQTMPDSLLTWLNARLPNIDDQIALREALNRAYPPSRWKTVRGILFITIGGWLMLNVLNAAVQWFVERGLSQLFS